MKEIKKEVMIELQDLLKNKPFCFLVAACLLSGKIASGFFHTLGVFFAFAVVVYGIRLSEIISGWW